jgi:hypothetical protein
MAGEKRFESGAAGRTDKIAKHRYNNRIKVPAGSEAYVHHPRLTTQTRNPAAPTRRNNWAGLSQFTLAVLTLGLSLDDDDFFDSIAGIQRGLDDFEQGQFSSLEDFVAEQNQQYGLVLNP